MAADRQRRTDCLTCGGALSWPHWKRCQSCVEKSKQERIAAIELKRGAPSGCCIACLAPVKTKRRMFCEECRLPSDNEYQMLAIRFVHAAIIVGDLPYLDGSIPCVDCGCPAAHYEHRDYWKPLDVEPTCVPCNFKRGPALHAPKRKYVRAPAK